jgi:hypothetical protein
MGSGRAGFYTHEWVERLVLDFGLVVPSIGLSIALGSVLCLTAFNILVARRLLQLGRDVPAGGGARWPGERPLPVGGERHAATSDRYDAAVVSATIAATYFLIGLGVLTVVLIRRPSLRIERRESSRQRPEFSSHPRVVGRRCRGREAWRSAKVSETAGLDERASG